METQKVININKSNDEPRSRQCEQGLRKWGKLTTGNKTFLKSNQLITKYVKQGNVQQNIMSYPHRQSKQVTSYDLCSRVIISEQEIQGQKRLRMNKINNDIKRNIRSIQNEEEEKQKQFNNEAKKIQLMVENMYVKAADIMFGRNNSTYTRKQADVNEIPLKQMKQVTTQKSLKKVQATRKCMIGKSHQMIENIQFGIGSQKSIANSSLLQDTLNTSILSNSTILSNQHIKKIEKSKNQHLLKKLLKNRSFEDLYNAKRRNAANEGFGMCWKLGVNDKKLNKTSLFDQQAKTMHKSSKKIGNGGYKGSYLNQICETTKCPLMITKKYSTAFEDRANSFALLQKA